MAKAEWGTKRICQSCGARFYDLLRDPVVCPKCGTTYDPEALLRSRRTRPAADPRPVADVAAVVAGVETEEDLVVADEVEDEVLEDDVDAADVEDDDETEAVLDDDVDIDGDEEPIVADEDDEGDD